MRRVEEVGIIGFGYGCAPCWSDLERKVSAVVSFETYEGDKLVRRDHLCGNHAEVLSQEGLVGDRQGGAE